MSTTLKIVVFCAFACTWLLSECGSSELERAQILSQLNESQIMLTKNAASEFWDTFYQWSLADIPKTSYNIMEGNNVCFTCPIDYATFNELRSKHSDTASVTWTANFPNGRKIFFCQNNKKVSSSPIQLLESFEANGNYKSSALLEFGCENFRLCLINVKYIYANSYECSIKEFIKSVKLNPISK